MNRSWDYRQYKRYVKGIKRIKIDRAEHGEDTGCPCFCEDATHGRGKEFSRFADTPVSCSNSFCCGFDTKGWYKDHPNKVPLEDYDY